MFEVAHHGVAAAQLCGATVPLVVIADAAVPNHGQNEGENPLVVTGGKERDEEIVLILMKPSPYTDVAMMLYN